MGEVLAGALVDRDVWSQGAARQKAQLDLQLARQALREAAITLRSCCFDSMRDRVVGWISAWSAILRRLRSGSSKRNWFSTACGRSRRWDEARLVLDGQFDPLEQTDQREL